MMEINSYDKYIVAFSGGKDSIACVLHLLDKGIPESKIELWHCLVDGRDTPVYMDWEITEDYCRKFAQSFNLDIYFMWKEGGFRKEMMRNGELTAPTAFETPQGEIKYTGGASGKPGTRLKFPQISPDLSVRWCSSYLKIDICAAAIRNQDRFNNIKTLFISGERGEESPARAKYNPFEPDRADLRNGKVARHVDRYRPIKDWLEQDVWDIIRKYGVITHPCYYLGWSRCSCKFCIFGNADQFASAQKVSPGVFSEIVNDERQMGVTMKRDRDLISLVQSGMPYKSISQDLIALATSEIYNQPIRIQPDKWELPAGAFKEGCGPT